MFAPILLFNWLEVELGVDDDVPIELCKNLESNSRRKKSGSILL